jgi:hypothetical protein
MDDIGGYTYKLPDRPTQINIELLPLGGITVEPVVFVGGVLLVSHEYNGWRLHEFQDNVLDNTVALLAARTAEAEIRAGERVEARMKNAKLPREERSTAKQQAYHSRKKVEALQTLTVAPMDYFLLTRTPLEPFHVSDVLDATSKVTTRQPGRGQNTNRMNLARAFAHQSGLTTVCKRSDVVDLVLRGSVSRVAERLLATAPVGRTVAALEQFTGTFDQEPVRFKQISKEPLRNLTSPKVRTKTHMAVVCDAGAEASTDAMKPWAFDLMSLKALNDPAPLLHKVPHNIGELNAKRDWAQAFETAATAGGVALRCQVHDDHFVVKLAQADVTDLSIDHFIIAANNATLETIGGDGQLSQQEPDTPRARRPSAGLKAQTHVWRNGAAPTNLAFCGARRWTRTRWPAST